MQAVKGKSILPGIAIGRLHIYKKDEDEIREEKTDDTEGEVKRFESARREAVSAQRKLYKKALEESGEDTADIFLVHRMILEDKSLIDEILSLIKEGNYTAEYAVREAFNREAAIIADTDDKYLSERNSDVYDTENELLAALRGEELTAVKRKEPTIYLADVLYPSDIVKADRHLFCGFVTKGGSPVSHTAILAKSMNLHAIIDTGKIDEEWEGKIGIIDGDAGDLYIDPPERLIAEFRKKQENELHEKSKLSDLIGKKSITIDGKIIKLFANINDSSEVACVMENDAEGIGLMRSEFLYFNRDDYPDEETQFKAYKNVVSSMAPKRVIIRTSDLGEDKMADYMDFDQKENPALGYRGVRVSLMRRDLFKTELRAILRASWYGNVGVMFPMLTSAWELSECIAALYECERELISEGYQIKQVLKGAMVETPAAVLIADDLAEMCDFLSIGTNDLCQYTLALDRENANLGVFYNSHHPALLREIAMTVAAGHRHNCFVSICGELAADISLTGELLGMGVDGLSVVPSELLKVRKKIRSLDLSSEE